MEQKKSLPVLVVGAGIAGINAALKLAESGTTVYLCERKPYIGGTLLQLDRWFPDNHCGMCQDLFAFNREVSFQHCFRQGLFHPRIRVGDVDSDMCPLSAVCSVCGAEWSRPEDDKEAASLSTWAREHRHE